MQNFLSKYLNFQYQKATLTWTMILLCGLRRIHTVVGWPWHWRWSSFKNSSSCKATSTVLLCVLYLLLLMKGHFSFQLREEEESSASAHPQPDFFIFSNSAHLAHMGLSRKVFWYLWQRWILDSEWIHHHFLEGSVNCVRIEMRQSMIHLFFFKTSKVS